MYLVEGAVLELNDLRVIFGCSSFFFVFLFKSSWKNMKNDNPFVRVRNDDHLGDAKMSKEAPRSVEFNFNELR